MKKPDMVVQRFTLDDVFRGIANKWLNDMKKRHPNYEFSDLKTDGIVIITGVRKE